MKRPSHHLTSMSNPLHSARASRVPPSYALTVRTASPPLPARAAAPSARCVAWQVAHAESVACRGSVRGTVRGSTAHPARYLDRAAITHAHYPGALRTRIAREGSPPSRLAHYAARPAVPRGAISWRGRRPMKHPYPGKLNSEHGGLDWTVKWSARHLAVRE